MQRVCRDVEFWRAAMEARLGGWAKGSFAFLEF